jgi:hypothetical protein
LAALRLGVSALKNSFSRPGQFIKDFLDDRFAGFRAVKLKLWPFLAARTAIGTRASARFSVNLQGDVEAA